MRVGVGVGVFVCLSVSVYLLCVQSTYSSGLAREAGSPWQLLLGPTATAACRPGHAALAFAWPRRSWSVHYARQRLNSLKELAQHFAGKRPTVGARPGVSCVHLFVWWAGPSHPGRVPPFACHCRKRRWLQET